MSDINGPAQPADHPTQRSAADAELIPGVESVCDPHITTITHHQRTWRSTVLVPALLSIVASIFGAIAGGILTILATESAVKAQNANLTSQIDEERLAQMREIRRQLYSDFLHTTEAARDGVTAFFSCLPSSAIGSGLTRDYLGSSGSVAFGPNGDLVVTQSPAGTTNAHFSMPVSGSAGAACGEAVEALSQAKLSMARAFSAMYPFASAEGIQAGQKLLDGIPWVGCDGHTCGFSTQVELADDDPFRQKDSGDQLIALGWKADAIAEHPYGVFLGNYSSYMTKFSRIMCKEILPVPRPEC